MKFPYEFEVSNFLTGHISSLIYIYLRVTYVNGLYANEIHSKLSKFTVLATLFELVLLDEVPVRSQIGGNFFTCVWDPCQPNSERICLANDLF
jgi:hypothetical protein